MDNMFKKIIYILVICIAMTAVGFILPACGDSNGSGSGNTDAEAMVKITFVQEGQEPQVIKIKKGENLTVNKVPTPVNNAREGYKIEWDRKVFNKITEDITVNAVEVPLTFSVRFDSNGGDPVADETYEYGQEYKLPTPTKAGYTFKGWYDGDQLVPSSGTWTLLHNPTFKAKWN